MSKTPEPTPAEYLDSLQQAHDRADWLLAEFLKDHRGQPHTLPSHISIIDLLGWSLRKQKQVRQAVSA